MKLYGSYTSPFVRHCRIALQQENLSAEFVDTDYAASGRLSPTAKVPFLEDGELRLTDSSTILKYIRETAGKAFLADLEDFEVYALANTALDTAINLFLLEKDGVEASQVDYLQRQKMRLDNTLSELNRRINPDLTTSTDGHLRCACLLDWALYRNRFSLQGLDNLAGLLEQANSNQEFLSTAPPAS